MADGAFPDLVSRNRDANSATNVMFVNLSDETNSLTIDGSGFITANINGSVTVTATDLDIRDLTHVSDSVKVGDGTDFLAVNTNGSIDVETPFNVDAVAGATDAVFPAGAVRDDALSTLTPVEGDYVNLRTDSTGALWVTTDDTINVNVVGGGTITGEIHDYDTASAVASDATSNHDYTVAGSGTETTFLLRSVIFSGSGNVKAEIQTGPLASLATVAVGFLTGRQGDTKQIDFNPPVEVPVASTGTVRVIRTNRQGAATDVYSTIIGQEV